MKVFALALSALFVASVIAQKQPEVACGGTTYDTGLCLSKVYKQVDADLNAAYQSAVKRANEHGPRDLQNLKDAEIKWIVYRDADCNAEYGLWGGGSGGPSAHTACLIKLTRERIAILRDVYLSH